MNQLEKNILENIRMGDEKAFEMLFKAYYNQLLNPINGLENKYSEIHDKKAPGRMLSLYY